MEGKPEQGIMAGREQFSIGLPKSSGQAPSPMQSMRLAFTPDGTAIYKPVASTSPTYQGAGAGGAPATGGESAPPAVVAPYGLNMGMVEAPIKRKRGRPRKYGPDGTMSLALSPASPPGTAAGSAGFPSPAAGVMGNAAASPPVKKVRGRPPGSGRKQQMAALGSPGYGFTPHVITVKTGEDVSSKIMSFSQQGSRAVCILSANGAISNVTLRQAAMSGGTVTYEGRFELLSLSGSFLLSESGGQRSRTGGLSVSLAGTDGRVLGGGVAGMLTAASPVQIVVGSFLLDGRKGATPASPPAEASPLQSRAPGSAAGPSSPPSRGTLSESSGGPASPPNQSSAACNNGGQQGMASMPWKQTSFGP